MLWLPDCAGELLAVTIDPSQSATTEWDGMLLVNTASFDWLDGEIDTEIYFDILAEVGLDPIDFVGQAQAYIEHLTSVL